LTIVCRLVANGQGGIIENAILTCNPPVVAARVVVERPPLEQYVRKMLLVDLSRSSVEKVLRQLRKMPWPESEQMVIHTLLQAVNEKFHNIHCVASVASGLATWYPLQPIDVPLFRILKLPLISEPVGDECVPLAGAGTTRSQSV
jgi:hypothetical protein